MQVVEQADNKTKVGKSSVALSTVSDYIHLFSIPSRSSCSFNISGVISAYHFSISGVLTAGWHTAAITATSSQEQFGIDGIYALRANMPVDGGPVGFYLVFGDNPSGALEVETVLNYASVAGEPEIFDMVLVSGPTSVKADLPIRHATANNAWGTTASLI